jgi:hypothetical protein
MKSTSASRLRARAAQRLSQALRVIDELGRGEALGNIVLTM